MCAVGLVSNSQISSNLRGSVPTWWVALLAVCAQQNRHPATLLDMWPTSEPVHAREQPRVVRGVSHLGQRVGTLVVTAPEFPPLSVPVYAAQSVSKVGLIGGLWNSAKRKVWK